MEFVGEYTDLRKAHATQLLRFTTKAVISPKAGAIQMWLCD
jgi:hypothetical protein